MKITRNQLRRMIESTIKPKNPLDYMQKDDRSKIEKMASLDPDSRKQARELAMLMQEPAQLPYGIGGADIEDAGYAGDDYELDTNKYNTPHLLNPDFNKYLKLSISAWIYHFKDNLIWAIQHDSNSLDELTELYFDYDDFVYTLYEWTETSNQEWIDQVAHTFPKPPDGIYEFNHHPRLINIITDIFKSEMLPIWEDWRAYFKKNPS